MRSAVVLLAPALLLASCSGGVPGAADPRTAVDTCLGAMNTKNRSALAKILAEEQRDQAAFHLSERGGKALTVESVGITRDFGPKFANAHVRGTYSDSSRYDEWILVAKRDDRWYVSIPWLNRVPPSAGKPTSAVPR